MNTDSDLTPKTSRGIKAKRPLAHVCKLCGYRHWGAEKCLSVEQVIAALSQQAEDCECQGCVERDVRNLALLAQLQAFKERFAYWVDKPPPQRIRHRAAYMREYRRRHYAKALDQISNQTARSPA